MLYINHTLYLPPCGASFASSINRKFEISLSRRGDVIRKSSDNTTSTLGESTSRNQQQQQQQQQHQVYSLTHATAAADAAGPGPAPSFPMRDNMMPPPKSSINESNVFISSCILNYSVVGWHLRDAEDTVCHGKDITRTKLFKSKIQTIRKTLCMNSLISYFIMQIMAPKRKFHSNRPMHTSKFGPNST